MRLRSAILLLAAMVFAAPDAFTHPLPDSTIFLDAGREQVEAELRLPAAQFEIGFGKRCRGPAKISPPACGATSHAMSSII